MSCLTKWLDYVRRRVKRILINQNYHSAKFYPHSILTVNLELSVAYEREVARFAETWCTNENNGNLVEEIKALKEIFETENGDDAVWYAELLSNKYANENVDRLIYARLRA
jgi:hypothetical protein